MVTRAQRARIPRRVKVWARELLSSTFTHSSHNLPAWIDLLSSWKSDYGVSTPPPGITVMRTVANLCIVNNSGTDAAVTWDLSCGTTWLAQHLIAGGGLSIPDPAATGQRETRFLHRWNMFFDSVAGLNGLVSNERGNPVHDFDSKQMGKQPTMSHQFGFVVKPVGTAAATQSFDLRGTIDVLLALP